MHCQNHFTVNETKYFPDHYAFSEKDIPTFESLLVNFGGSSTGILVTEKDAIKIKEIQGMSHLPIYYIPIQMNIIETDQVKWTHWWKTQLKTAMHWKSMN
jgi:tetraacyldisaccharide-1-P 4'-kinase